MSGRQLGIKISQTGKSIGVGYFDASEKTARLLLRLKPELKWMLTATPLVNNLRDLGCVIRFLEREEWLELSLPPDTFVDRDDLKDNRVMQRLDPMDSPAPLPNVPGTHPNAVTPDILVPYIEITANHSEGEELTLSHDSVV